MKPFILLVTVLFAFAALSNAASLRKQQDNNLENVLEIEFTEDEYRFLQQGASSNNSSTTQDTSNANLINRVVHFLLPYINKAIATYVPDPLNIPLSGEQILGQVNILSCTATAGFTYNFGAIDGLSTLFIDKLDVVLGTENVNAGFFNTVWNGVFDMTIASTQILNVSNLQAGFSASACGVQLNPTVGGGIRTYQPILRGFANISGSICGRVAKINSGAIRRALDVNYNKIEAYLDNVPAVFNNFIGDATTQLSLKMKEQWNSTLVPKISPQVEKSLVQKQRMNFHDYLSINSAFLENAGKRRSAAVAKGFATILGFAG